MTQLMNFEAALAVRRSDTLPELETKFSAVVYVLTNVRKPRGTPARPS
jgi:hypothetical protein